MTDQVIERVLARADRRWRRRADRYTAARTQLPLHHPARLAAALLVAEATRQLRRLEAL